MRLFMKWLMIEVNGNQLGHNEIYRLIIFVSINKIKETFSWLECQ